MSRKTHIYEVGYSGEVKLRDILNYGYDDLGLKYLQRGEMHKLYSSWNSESMIISPENYQYPIIDNLGNLRNKTTEELKLDGVGLVDGEVVINGEIIIIEKPNNQFESVWNGSQWVENKTPEEQRAIYFETINKHKATIMNEGYEWKGHKQKVREKDVALLGNAIAGLEDYKPDGTLQWSFSDEDISALTLNDLKELRGAGVVFINKVYEVEAILKSEEPVVSFSLEEFKSRVESHVVAL